ncbi:MAG TPA: aminotransferase class I/II-fold pyridoxal phosphate-dependent enzyme, partial [Agriterribacter sp.]|nr:aminotransferase class I/II-fold pyridoxal phosphate-dependent enzyme [Agriterribacter sp.]
MHPKIWLSSPHMGGNERKFVNEAFDTNWVAPLGPNVNGLEKDIARFLFPEDENNIHVAALSSGTAALHLGLILLGVKPGDEVICQSMTFSASANPVAYQGATPVFVDSEPDTWNMSPEFLEKAIKDRIAKGRKPKVVIPVHLYGMPAKMDEIMAIAGRYEIPVLEDAAEALGSHINGIMCGTYGVISALSFNGNKIITTSGGGALVTHEKELAEKARFLSTQARDPAPHYQHSHIGYNYRMSNICAGVGRGQMEVLSQRILQRRANFDWYNKALNDTDAVHFLREPGGYYSNRWLTTVLVRDPVITRETLRLALDKVNIESRPLW